MKFSEQWLREWVNPQISTSELVEQLTMAGLEVDGVEPVAADFSNVVVGEIVQVEAHPDADKLRVCQVKSDEAPVQVVCGAANAAVGLKVPFAKLGAVLPGDFKIKKAKLRGVESFGMLCAAEELGLSESSDGLLEFPADAPVGKDVREYLQLDDTIIEVDLTPNRGDCLGMAGLAREVGVLNKARVDEPVINPVDAVITDTFPVEIRARKECPGYAGRVIKNIDVTAPTPLWMQERLRRGGIRSIDAVVDVTNYVLLELGQPMHAFDLDKLSGSIVVRHAEAGEKLTLLDGQSLDLKEGSVLIADQQEALALAGIMGGKGSGVTAETTDIFLESAFFTPELIAGRARSYGLHTDSSHRFERGVDFQLQSRAIERATQLLLTITGGQPGPLIEVVCQENLPEKTPILLRKERIASVLGLQMASAEVEEILRGLGLDVLGQDKGWLVSVPSYRFDIAIEADLLEELARIYGYNRLPVRALQGGISLRSSPEARVSLSVIKNVLVARGYQEAVTYSFVAPDIQALVNPDVNPVKLSNPISADMSVMRTSLISGLLSAARYNINRQKSRLRFFESGLTFVPAGDELLQKPMLAGLITGARNPESWNQGSENSDFYDIKGDVEALLSLTGASEQYQFVAATHTALHPGQTAQITINGELAGWVGALHPALMKKLGFSAQVYIFELYLDVVQRGKLPQFKELSKFPEVRRDLSIIINQEIESSAVFEAIRSVAGEYLTDLTLFDVYQGKGIDSQRKSLALGLTFQHQSRTLNEEEVKEMVDTVVAVLQKEFDASLRN